MQKSKNLVKRKHSSGMGRVLGFVGSLSTITFLQKLFRRMVFGKCFPLFLAIKLYNTNNFLVVFSGKIRYFTLA